MPIVSTTKSFRTQSWSFSAIDKEVFHTVLCYAREVLEENILNYQAGQFEEQKGMCDGNKWRKGSKSGSKKTQEVK